VTGFEQASLDLMQAIALGYAAGIGFVVLILLLSRGGE